MKEKARILVTGAAGFIGSHLCDRLLTEGATVTAIDDLSLGRRENLKPALGNPDFAFIRGDILDPGALDPLFQNGGFKTVFHMAANSDIQRGSRESDRDLSLTFLTTFRVLDAMKKFNVREFVFASSSAIYGEVDGEIDEDHGPLRPVSFYGAAKNAGESYTSAFAHRFAMRAWIYRFPNVVGSRMTHGVVHDFIDKLRDDPTRLAILGDGEQCKPYLHVRDLIDAMLLGCRRLSGTVNCLNIGVETRTTVRRIAEIVVKEMGLGEIPFDFTGGAGGWEGDIPRYRYDLSRIKKLGWRPRVTSDKAIRAAVRETLNLS
ncbi:MAG: NAD-dependent epimerase/dehydratase family protein [PVC group bacterium]